MQANKIISNKPKYIKQKEKQRQRTGAIGVTKKVSTMKRRMDTTTLEYYQALLDPEYAAVNNIEVKFPAPYDLPTKCVNVKNSWETKVNTSGNCLITWRPNYLVTKPWAKEAGKWAAYTQNSAWLPYGDPLYVYSQVTINNEAAIDGETQVTGGLNFQPMKEINLPIVKYRLVSAKMTIEYIGRNDDESGSITSGQWVGDLTPAAFVAQGVLHGIYSASPTLSNCSDQSKAGCQFGQFDVIRDLPYGNVKALKKGEIYSYYYYPIDHNASTFTVIGQYGTTEKAKLVNIQDTTSNKKVVMSISDFAQNLSAELGISGISGTTTFNSNYEGTNRVTAPSYIVAISGLSSTASANDIRINLYENYECIFAPELSMLSTATGIKLNTIVANQVQQTMFSRLAQGVKDMITKPVVKSAINGAMKIVGNMAPLSNIGRLGRAIKVANSLMQP